MATKAIDFRAVPASRQVGLSPALRDALLMLVAALLVRCWWFGDPVVQVDEQFYLLVGDRVLHGALPFVDIWDRKPIGLFLLYAGIRLLGGDGIIQYQLVATLLAGTTAFFIVLMARLFASEAAARTAGVVSLLWTIVFDGAGGQAPVVYNPFVAAAAYVTLRAILDRRRGAGLTRAGALAMLLLGLAIQIKYTVMFEGMGFGLLLVWQGWRSRDRLPRVAARALLWIGIAVAPTALVLAGYAVAGHGEAFVYANFLSIGDRPASEPAHLAARLGKVMLLASPLALAAMIGLRRRGQGDAERVRRFVGLWAVAAIIGFLAIGTLYGHYFLPAVVPLSLAAARALDMGDRRFAFAPRRAIALAAIGLTLAAGLSIHRLAQRGDGRQVELLAAAIEARPGRCLFVFDGEPILYHLTRRCLTSRYAFPNHLNQEKEAAAIGVDPVNEVRRILAERPPLIVSSNRPAKDANPLTWAMMRAALSHDYRPVAYVPINHRLRILYQRRTERTAPIWAATPFHATG